MSTELTADQRVALLEQLEKQEADRRRKAVRTAWGSVVVAAVLVVLLVFGAWSYLRLAQSELSATKIELRDATKARDDIVKDIEHLNRSKAEVEAQLKTSKAALSASLGALGRVSEPQRKAAVEQELTADPNAAQLLPRAYLQIVDAADREWAKEIGRKLQAAGIIAIGVEYVAKSAGLKRTDVRYYKKSERAGAETIVALLKDAGVDASLIYLNQESNTKVRPNHFEVWFAAGARELRPR